MELELYNQQTLLDLNKDYLGKIVQSLTADVSNGNQDAIKVLVYAKKGAELFSALEKSIRPYAEENSRISKGEVLKQFNCEISERESGVKYDFTACNDPEWNELNQSIEKLSEQIKAREAFLKTLTKPLDIVVNDAEVVTVLPPIRSGKLGIVIKIK